MADNILFGGEALDSGAELKDVWALQYDGGANTLSWRALTPEIDPITIATLGARNASVWREPCTDQKLQVYSGFTFDSGGLGTLSDAHWSLTDCGTLCAWLQNIYDLADPRPLPHEDASVAVDPFSSQAVLFGGLDTSGVNQTLWTADACQSVNGADWRSVVDFNGPSPRAGASIHFLRSEPVAGDNTSQYMLLGGYDGQETVLTDLWLLSYNHTATLPSWQPLSPHGIPPSPRYHYASQWNEQRQQLWLFGGSLFKGGYEPLGGFWTLKVVR